MERSNLCTGAVFLENITENNCLIKTLGDNNQVFKEGNGKD